MPSNLANLDRISAFFTSVSGSVSRAPATCIAMAELTAAVAIAACSCEAAHLANCAEPAAGC